MSDATLKRVLISFLNCDEILLVALEVPESTAQDLVKHNNCYIGDEDTSEEDADWLGQFFYDGYGTFQFEDQTIQTPLTEPQHFDVVVSMGCLP